MILISLNSSLLKEAKMKNITIEIPLQLQQYTEQVAHVELVAVNVGEALLALCQHFPLLTSHLIDEQGEIDKTLSICIDRVNIEHSEGLNTLLKEDNLLRIEVPTKS